MLNITPSELRDADERVRLRAVKSLCAQVGSTSEGDRALAFAAADEHVVVRATALQGLVEAVERSADRVAPLLEDPEPEVRQGAILALRSSRSAATRHCARLVRLLLDPEVTVFRAADGVLESLGAPALPALVAQVTPTAGAVAQIRLLSLLERIGLRETSGMDTLLSLLDAPDPTVRQSVIRCFGSMPAPTRAVTSGLVRCLGDDAEAVRYEAASAMGRGSPPAAETLDALRVALGDAAARVRRAAIQALSRWGAESAAVRCCLRAALASADAEVREQAILALTPAAGFDPASAASIGSALHDAQSTVCMAAVEALLPSAENASLVLPVLRTLLRDADERVRLRGVLSLRQNESTAGRTLDWQQIARQDPSPSVRCVGALRSVESAPPRRSEAVTLESVLGAAEGAALALGPLPNLPLGVGTAASECPISLGHPAANGLEALLGGVLASEDATLMGITPANLAAQPRRDGGVAVGLLCDQLLRALYPTTSVPLRMGLPYTVTELRSPGHRSSTAWGSNPRESWVAAGTIDSAGYSGASPRSGCSDPGR